jgi:ABC-type transport system substrate-binding protein
MNMDYPDSEFLIRNFESKNPDNFSGISDPALDRLIADARKTNDRLVRAELYKRVVRKLEELAVTVNLFHPRAHNWVSPCVKGFEPNILADYYIDYRKIGLDRECQSKFRGHG